MTHCPQCGFSIPKATGLVICVCGHRYQGDGLPGKYERDLEKHYESLRSRWRELHAYDPEVWDIEEAKAWFAKWLAKIPQFGCKCRQHFLELIEKHPPTFASREDFYLWTVDRHNDVNERLGKPIWRLDEQGHD